MQRLPNQREGLILGILLTGEKYGREIRNEFETMTRTKFPLGSLYVTLDRMVQKGFVKCRDGSPKAEYGDSRRKYFALTAEGHSAANAVRSFLGFDVLGKEA